MTARPIRRNAQTPDRNGKIFYTSTTSLSHISKKPGYETVDGRRRCRPHRHHPCTSALRPVRLIVRRWLGLDWDGEILYQSERTAVYEKYEAILREKVLLYPCFCSRAALHAASAPHLSDGRVVYAGTCRDLTPEQVAEKRRKRAPATRVRVPERTITFTDGVYGAYTETLTEECGDFIIRRSDGVFAYQLAVVVDDGLSGVTEVVRGHDLIGSTPRQIWLYELFGFTPPNFIHIPLLCDHDGRRLSKRDEDLDLGLLREKFTPEQVIGALACAAGLTDTAEPVSAKELVKAFSWEKIPKHELYLPNVFRGIRN